MFSSSLFGVVTIPTTIDMEEYVEAAVAAMTPVAGAAIAGAVAFLILRRALGWLRGAVR